MLSKGAWRKVGWGRMSLAAGLLGACFLVGTAGDETGTVDVVLDQLRLPVRVVSDTDGVRHVFAKTDHDALVTQGYLQAEDRLFQMDYLRRLFSGTSAELLGPSALASDTQLRTFGFRRAAVESYNASSPEVQALLRAYADGVNAYLNSHPQLPEEYSTLELTQVAPWDPVDTLTIVKGVVFARSFDFTFEVEATVTLSACQEAGMSRGFDGNALFFADLFRAGPFDSAATVPDAAAATPAWALQVPRVKTLVGPETLRLARNLIDSLGKGLFPRMRGGSNVWAVAGGSSQSGAALLANDPHLELGVPSTWYETHLVVSDDPVAGPLDASGVTIPGIPGIAIGCGSRVCWGITTNPADVADTFQETLVYDSQRGMPTHTRFDGTAEPLTAIPQTFRVNQIGDGLPNNLTNSAVSPLQGGVVFLVPRRNNGPLLFIDVSNPNQAVGLSFQYTGARDTRDWEGLFGLARARDVADFGKRLAAFDATFNFVCADKEGAVGYFASGEIPLREDLQNLGRVDGLPPFLIRDGSHSHHNEWIAAPERGRDQSLRYAILPDDELPHAILSGSGFIVNANNDPLGDLADNDAVNQTRPAGGIRYLLWQSLSLRAGEIGRRLASARQQSGRISGQDMRNIQSSTVFSDAEFFRPFILTALQNAQRGNAPAGLATLANDAAIQEAVQRISAWDLTSPTGVTAGFDAGDNPAAPPAPTTTEIANSVAATIYALWRGRFISNVIDATLSRVGLAGQGPKDFELPLTALKNLLDNFAARQGVGASGLNFFQIAGLAGSDARDYWILKSLRDGLTLAASPAYAPAFSRSQVQDNYRWGMLHRIVFGHPLGDPFNIPEAGGFHHLSMSLPGLSRPGGFETIDNGPGGLRGPVPSSFTFDTGASLRLLVEMAASGAVGSIILPGGQSGNRNSPFFANQLGRWLVNDNHPLRIDEPDIESATLETARFAPSMFRLFFPYFETASDSFAGFAAASLADVDQTVTYRARSGNGLDLALVNNPAASVVSPGRQEARLAEQIFSIPVGQPQSGWVELTSSLGGSGDPPIASFAQFGAFDLSRLDGAVAISQPYSRLLFTRVYEGAQAFRGRSAETVLNVANTDGNSVSLRFRLFSGVAGAAPVAESVRPMPGHGWFSGTISQAFGHAVVAAGGYVEVTATGGEVVGFELIRLRNPASLIGLNAAIGEPSERMFSAQVASSNAIFTSLKLVNRGADDRRIMVELIASDGSRLSDPFETTLAPGQSWEQDLLPEAAAGAEAGIGSLTLTTNGDGIVGDVIFGAPDLTYAAGLQLQGRTFEEAVFPHVANLFGTFFTGVALYNPSPLEAEVELEVFTPGGVKSGEASLTLAPGTRLSQTLDQLAPGSAGQVGGYVVIRSTQPLVGQELFGTTRLSLLSAVPPTRLR